MFMVDEVGGTITLSVLVALIPALELVRSWRRFREMQLNSSRAIGSDHQFSEAGRLSS